MKIALFPVNAFFFCGNRGQVEIAKKWPHADVILTSDLPEVDLILTSN